MTSTSVDNGNGDGDGDVVQLQTQLTGLGTTSQDRAGVYGPSTTAGVQNFQPEHCGRSGSRRCLRTRNRTHPAAAFAPPGRNGQCWSRRLSA